MPFQVKHRECFTGFVGMGLAVIRRHARIDLHGRQIYARVGSGQHCVSEEQPTRKQKRGPVL